MQSNEGGVVWITGFSGAGKTTVGRKVENELRHRGISTVFLDGDDLRRIFAGKWGYDRSDRLELAKVYFRLSNHLASQRITVVISAIAMYAEVFAWVKTNIARAMVVYLRVPDEERLRRDNRSKQVYKEISRDQTRYDEPRSADVLIDNYGDVDPQSAARTIVDAYLGRHDFPLADVDHGKGAYWDAEYVGRSSVQPPSAFAIAVADQLGPSPLRILEVGCGDGRDAAYLSQRGHRIVAIDASRSAIEACRANLAGSAITFRNATVESVAQDDGARFDVIYCRFVLHAMTAMEEGSFIRIAHDLLNEGGRLLLECRSINDPLSRQGEVISPTERIYGHYRRFIVLEELEERLRAAGFAIESAAESNGWAVHQKEDPVVIRAIARKMFRTLSKPS